jgi:glutaredoxin 3
MGGHVYYSTILFWVAIHKIWLYTKFIVVRLNLLWLGQDKTTTRRRRMKAVVWSKPACPFCVKAKNLLKNKGIEYEEKNIAEGYKIQDLLDLVPNARTMPQIWLDEEHIGGYYELEAKLKDQE